MPMPPYADNVSLGNIWGKKYLHISSVWILSILQILEISVPVKSEKPFSFRHKVFGAIPTNGDSVLREYFSALIFPFSSFSCAFEAIFFFILSILSMFL
jgi:hypothetical protein